MAKRRCAACGCLFEPRRNVPQQRYCSERACQRTRRRRWQRQKLKTDGDYRANLPEHHRDPADRLITATAIEQRARLISLDSAFPPYFESPGMLIGS